MVRKKPETAGTSEVRPPVEKTRNQQIIELIAKDLVPLLPFEFTLLDDQMDDHREGQQVLGRLLAEAMDQSSETWHDNAPADAINSESRTLAHRAKGTINTLRNGHDQGYPDKDFERVTLGSVVGVSFGEGAPVQYMLLTGYCREIPADSLALLPPETEAVTLSSPIGSALFDSLMGDQVSYQVNSRTIHVAIAELQQFAGTPN